MAFNQYMPMPQYGQYNTLAPYQQQLDQMQRQWSGMQPQQAQQPMQQPIQQSPAQIRGYPVQGEEEARRAIIDVDGSIFWFPDMNGGKVYSKQINTATFDPVFRTYHLVEAQAAPAVQAVDTSMFAQRDEVDQLKESVVAMQEIISQLTAPVKEAKAK